MKPIHWILIGIHIFIILVIPLAVFAEEQPQTPPCGIEKLVMARAVEDREPVDEDDEFDAALGKVYCWMKVNCQNPPTTIKHVWYRDDQKVFQLALEIKYATMRTWSVKGIDPGNWRVDVVDKAEQVIGSVRFHVE